MKSSAFTLLEVLVYLALAAMFLGAIIGCAYGLATSAQVEQAKILLQFEGGFVEGKFAWAFLGAKNFSVSGDGESIAIFKYNSSWPIVFNFNGGHISLIVNGAEPMYLNNDNLVVSGLRLADVPAVNGRAEGVNVGFAMEALSQSGRPSSETFNFTEYLRQ